MNACRKFEPYKIKSGNITTNHIVLNDKGHVKVKNQLTEPEENTSSLANFFSTYKSYEGPEEMQCLRENRSTKLHPNICQTFSIAMIIIEICTFM